MGKTICSAILCPYLLILITGCASVTPAESSADATEMPLIRAEQLHTRLATEEPTVILDVRDANQYAAMHIPGAVSTPAAEIFEDGSDANAAEPKTIALPEAWRHYQDGRAVWVDVRDEDDYADSHIAGAINVPLISLRENLDRLPPDSVIVLYCGGRVDGRLCTAAHSAGRMLITRGYPATNVLVFEDGPPAWKKAGYPMESDR